MTENDESPHAACALTASEHAARIAWIEELNKAGLRSYQRNGRRIRLAYDPAAVARAHEWVRKDFDKVAVVGAPRWEQWCVNAAAAVVMSGGLRTFDRERLDAAWQWVRA